MNLIRLLIIALIIWLLLKLWRRYTTQKQVPPKGKSAERMVKCDHCGIYVPRSDALRQGERWYCGIEHQDVNKD